MTASGYKVTVHKLIVQIVLIRSVFQILYTVAASISVDTLLVCIITVKSCRFF